MKLPPYPPQWCGAFALWCLHRAGLCEWPWVIDEPNKHWGFCWRLNTTSYPKAGDTAYFAKHQHHAIWVGDGRVINGNGEGGEVTVTRVTHAPDVFYSIDLLVQRYDT